MAGFFWLRREIARLSIEAGFVAQEFLNPHRDQPVFVSPEQDRVPYDQDFPERVPDVQERAFLLIFFFRLERERRLQVIPLVPAVRDEVDFRLLPAIAAAFAFLADFDDADVDRKPTVSEPVKNNIFNLRSRGKSGLEIQGFQMAVLLVSHRESRMRIADEFLSMEGGRIS